MLAADGPDIMSDRSVFHSDDAQAVRAALENLLTDCQGNVTLASRRAGVERQSMHRLLKRHGLAASDYRPRGGGSIIARAALKNLGTQLPRDFSRAAVREVKARTIEHAVPVPTEPAEVSPRDIAARA